jgi:hypothetical protein
MDGYDPAGILCAAIPRYARQPPIEAAVFAWGVSEDRQLGLDTEDNVMKPKVVESLLGRQFRGREFGRYVNTVFFSQARCSAGSSMTPWFRQGQHVAHVLCSSRCPDPCDTL